MTKQQAIGVTILIGVLLGGMIFQFYSPVHALTWIILVIFAAGFEAGWIREEPKGKPKNKYPTIEDIRRKYPKRLSKEQLRQQSIAKKNRDIQEAVERREKERLQAIESYELKSLARAEASVYAESQQKEIELINLTHSRDTAERILKGLRKKYPDKTRLWLVEKAIADIERDRRVN